MTCCVVIHPAGILASSAPAIHPEGILAISRGSSEANTPGSERPTRTDPEGVAPSAQSTTPPGSNAINATDSGGAPIGDPRLIADTPPGSIANDSTPAGSSAHRSSPSGSKAATSCGNSFLHQPRRLRCRHFQACIITSRSARSTVCVKSIRNGNSDCIRTWAASSKSSMDFRRASVAWKTMCICCLGSSRLTAFPTSCVRSRNHRPNGFTTKLARRTFDGRTDTRCFLSVQRHGILSNATPPGNGNIIALRRFGKSLSRCWNGQKLNMTPNIWIDGAAALSADSVLYFAARIYARYAVIEEDLV